MYLFDSLAQHAALYEAWKKIKAKKAAGGIDRVSIEEFDRHLNKNIDALVSDLKENRYVPVPFRQAEIPKFTDLKEKRTLSLPAIRDKIVQQAVLELIEPKFERDFLDCSYAYRKGKGPQKAIRRLEYYLKYSDVQWAIRCDIDDFFDTINHDLLIDEVSKKIHDKKILNLIRLWLKAGLLGPRGEFYETTEGIAQGAIISPLLANIYLHRFDVFMTQKGYNYIRYSDDFIVLTGTKKQAYKAFDDVLYFMKDVLKLKLNENPYPFKHVDSGFTFLGIYFRGGIRRIANGKMGKIFNKINWYTDKFKKWTKDEFFKKIKESVEGIKTYYSFINPREQFSEIEAHLQKRLGFLVAQFFKRGEIKDKNEALAFVSTIPLLNPHSEKEIKKWQEEVISKATSIYEHIAPKEEKPKQPPRISRLVSAQKHRFIKQYATESQIIVSTPGVFIGKVSERLVLRQQRKNLLELPFFKVKDILVTSRGISVSSDLIHSCVKNKIPINFLNPYGFPYAVVEAPIFSMGSIAVLQIRAYETEKALELAKRFVEGKIKNQINLLKFYARSRKTEGDLFFENLSPAISKMQANLKELDTITISQEDKYAILRDRLFSSEGRASNEYWRLMRLLLSPELGFNGRRRRGATDLVNAMLNYGYGILYQRAWKALVLARLNPHISFLHAFQRNKPTLVYDFIEEFRQPIVDRAIFSMLRRGKRGIDLKLDEKGMLSKETKNKTITTVIKRLSSLVTFRGNKIKLEDVIILQAKNLVRHLEGKQKYRPFLARY